MSRNSWLLVGILGLALFLRVWGIPFGLPEAYHADEPIVVNHAVAYGTGDFHPHFFKIPPLVSYLLFVVYGGYYGMGRLVGWFSGVGDFEHLFMSDPTSFYLIARMVFGALLGVTTVFLFYRLVRRWFSEKHALLSAFFLAVSFLHVRDSHYIYADIPLLAVLVASFDAIFQIYQKGKRRDYFRFGIFAGLAVATKYNGVFIFVPFLVAHILRRGLAWIDKSDAWALGTGVLSLLVFAMLNPYSWLDARFFLSELLTQGGSQGQVHFFHHLTYSLREGLGVTLWANALAGIGLALTRPEGKKGLFLSFVFFYYCPVLVFFSQPYDRYVLPLIPFAAFFAADFLIWVESKLRLSKIMMAALIFFVAIPSLAKVVLSNVLFTAQDVRDIAKEWVEKEIPTNSKIAMDIPFFMPRLKPTIRRLETMKDELTRSGETSRAKRLELLLAEAQRKPSEPRYESFFLRDQGASGDFLFARPSVPYDLKEIETRGIKYVVVTRIHNQQNQEFYTELKNQAKQVARFTPYRDPAREAAVDPRPLTGGPFLWEELLARKRNGQILEVYQL